MGVHPSLVEGHNLWSDSWSSRVQLTISGTFNALYYCAIFMVYAWLTNVKTGRGVETHDLKVFRENMKICFNITRQYTYITAHFTQ